MTTSKQSVITELAALPHVGETIAKSAYEELGIRSVDDLIEAAENGKLQKLKGIGAKKEQAIHDAGKKSGNKSGNKSGKKNGVPDILEGKTSLDSDLAADALDELGPDRVRELYRDMLFIRRFEEQAGRQYQMGKIKGFCHLYIGQEAVAVGSLAAVREDDYVITAYREHGHALARGLDANSVMAELFGKKTGTSGGKGGSMHLFDVEKHFYGGWGIVGGHVPTAAGMAFAAKYRDEDSIAICYLGDGSIHQGVVHETMNMAVLWDLPLVLVIENNQYGMGTALERASSLTDLSKKGDSHGFVGEQVDGQDIFAVRDAVLRAAKRAREEGQPTLLDVITYRYRGHSMSDPAKYRSKDEVESQQKVGPLVRMHKWLLNQELSTEEELDELDKDLKAKAKEAVKFAEDADSPDASALTENVYVDWTWDIE